MKIRKLHIKNYKVFNDLQLDFTDANGNTLDKIVLAGVNGCGKTTILELIKKMFDRTLFTSQNEFLASEILMEVELLDSEKTSILSALYLLKGLIEEISKFKEVCDNCINYLLSTKKYYSFTFKGKDEYNSLDTFFLFAQTSMVDYTRLPSLFYLPVHLKDHEINLSKTNVITDVSKTEADKNTVLRIVHLESSKEDMKNLALASVRREIFENMDTPPRESIENAIKKINAILGDIELSTKLVDLKADDLIFKSINGQRVTFEDLSNGEKILYFRAIYIGMLNLKNSIIMIDEPEGALHPSWQQKILKSYQSLGENNQVIVATHSPHIIGASKAEEVFLLEIDENNLEARHPKYTKGHSISYILEVMGANPNDTVVIDKVNEYLAVIRQGQQETGKGRQLKAEIDALDLDPNSEEMRRLDLSIKRFKAVGV